jgi:two-component sensor histidine kinase
MTVNITPSADVSLNLVHAVVGSSNTPLLLLDGDCEVIAASTSFCREFRVAEADIPDRKLFDLGTGEWDVPQLRSLLAATVAGHADIGAYEMDLRPKGLDERRLIVSAKRLAYAEGGDVRLVLSVVDVTDARTAEKLRQDLLREMADMKRDKAMLLQELQHRVANSLQIIASVLLQTARRVQSDETRTHLHDAHQRVMSVAALQKQLAVSTMDDVKLRSYFADLCQSIGASMIRDHNKLSLLSEVDDSRITADVSVSLGLIITELVINALKHAFPNDRSGKILVGYQSIGSEWTLTVRDDGVGMAESSKDAKPGLGTSIVTALARQLNARVTVAAANPGTAVSVVHTNLANGSPPARLAQTAV